MSGRRNTAEIVRVLFDISKSDETAAPVSTCKFEPVIGFVEPNDLDEASKNPPSSDPMGV